MSIIERLRRRLGVSADLREGAGGWVNVGGRGSAERSSSERTTQYRDALEAWRTNPYAKRIIDIITDYTVGDGISPVAAGEIGRFVDTFWTHPQNRLDLRLPDLMDELSRAGDLFLILFRNPADGMSYVRALPKSEIQDIRTSAMDWEKEIEIIQKPANPGEPPTAWPTINHPDAAAADAIAIHYAINRPVGALLGNSELSTLTVWLQRYSRMLEDRIRLNWAARSFLWFVQVPTNQIKSKAEQYNVPPEPGSIIVHDDGEKWDMKSPALHGNDAAQDLLAMRQLIAAGSGQPPHWHGDGGDVNLSTAKAMNDPAIRHLRRRQRHFQYVITDLCTVAYGRAYEIGGMRTAPRPDAITVDIPDISREDNSDLASAAANLSTALATLSNTTIISQSPTLRRKILQLVFKFAGETITPSELNAIDREQEAAELQPQPEPQPEGAP